MTLTVGPADAPETVDRSGLEALRDALEEAQRTVQSALNTVELARGTVALGKATLLPLAQAYGRKVRGLFTPGSPFIGMTPEMPEDSSAQETFLRPMRDIGDAWLKIESGNPAFTLPPAGTTRASFAGKVQDLSGEWKALNTAEVNYGYELDKRNALQVLHTDDILGRYRPTVVSLFAPENPLVLSIPRLSPAAGPHTGCRGADGGVG